MSKIAYYAEPIDQTSIPDTEQLSVRDELIRQGWSVYRPRTAWSTHRWPDARIEQANRAVLQRVDLLVAWLPVGAASVGVPREIEAATRQGVPVVVVGAGVTERQSLTDVNTFENNRQFARWLQGFDHHHPNRPTSPTPGVRLPYTLVPGTSQWGGPQTPLRGYPDDAGLDLFTSVRTVIPANCYGRIRCGVEVAFPPDLFGWVVARSSTFREYGLIVLPGIIDTGYRGEIEAVAWNTNDVAVTAEPGSRIAQLILLPNIGQNTTVQQVDSLPDSERGSNGFGSTTDRS